MLTEERAVSLHPERAATPRRKVQPMRRIMTALAVVWLASLGVMAAMEMSRHAASAAAVTTPKGISP